MKNQRKRQTATRVIITLILLGITVSQSWASEIEFMSMVSSPTRPDGYGSRAIDALPQSAVVLSQVPTSTWTYGCSATSAGMMFGYYDRTGYSNMYTGPANGGVAPLTNLGQGIGAPIPGSTSLIATQNGFDGRVTDGHVDDYWISYGSNGPDPWESSGTEHTWGGCTADYMGTNQWKWDMDLNGNKDNNVDGGTLLWTYGSANKLYDYIPSAAYGLPQTALSHGMRLFAESRGYTVLENYTQKIDAVVAGGFSFADYMAEIDAGCPVMVQVEGHSMVGVGYDTNNNQVLLHDTWDNNIHYMTWGSSYSGMNHFAMTVIHLEAIPEPCTILLLAAGMFGLRRKERRL
ncbi:MAG: C39 family peptidase [Sedimentisphaerales bacterium]|nr:C39 family peptidase [Sedimentisphaerales bacterium]